MRITDAYNSKAIAAVHEEVASNKLAYLGEGFFPRAKKTSLDLKVIKTSKGLPVSLAPSAFDTKATIRSREGFKILATEMAFFKESMVVKEQDEQDIMRVQDSADPFAQEVLNRVFNDAETLIEGADVVPERMRMQLLSSCYVDQSSNPHGPNISIAANGATYSYDYDPDGTYATNNYIKLTGTSVWSDTTNADPIKNIQDAILAVEARTGSRPTKMIVSLQTMNYLIANKNIRSYVLAQNSSANIYMNEKRVKAAIKEELNIDVIVYSKQFKTEDGTVTKFFPDGFATLVPDGALGNTWYGMTPDERTGVLDKDKDVSIVGTGVAVSVVITNDPVQTQTFASEIVLPSFERIDETYQIECY
jgi:hypothetical protein